MRKIMVLLLVLSILITSCSQLQEEIPLYERTGGEAEEAGEEGQEEGVEEPEEQELSCEEWAESMFPSSWVFLQEVTQDPILTKEILGLREGTWSDGAMIRGTSSTKIQKGSEAGENINYYYSKPIFPGLDEEKYGFLYSEKIIDDKGTVLGENSFKIRPVFKVFTDIVKDEENKWGDPIKIRYLTVTIVEPNIVSCERVD